MEALKVRLFFTLIMILAYVRPIVGNCQQPFSGPNCKIRNIAYNLRNLQAERNVLRSSSFQSVTFYPYRAFDGDLSSAFITNAEPNPYLWVNLKSNFTLHTMTLYTGANRPSDINGFKIEVAYTSDFQTVRLCYQDQSSQGQPVYHINCTQPIEGQYVRIQIPTTPNNPRSLIVYEFEIYQCEDGYYGPDCTPCGQCQNGAKCDNINGECPDGCRLGFAGMRCNECADGYYGLPNCTICGQSGVQCNKISGECPGGCVQGRKPKLCQTECDDGTYGLSCLQRCGKCANNAVCDKEDGTCPAGCSPRFTGQRCDECADGYYGFPNCNTCGLCRDGDHCNKINGECPNGCVLGRTGKLCQAGCDDGFYGQGCTDQCGNCANNKVCNKTDGSCPKGCNSRFTGKLCKECKDGFYGENCTACGQCQDQKPCNKINGKCSNGCEKGRKATLCQECEDGFFGVNCSKMCHCLNDTEICNKTTGNCSTCAAGFVGEDCQDCSKNRFGKDCQGICHCADNDSCHPVSGNCRGECSSGFVGENCQSAIVAECAEGYSGINCEISSKSPDCCLCDTVDGARSVVRDDAIDKTCKSPTGYIVGLCIAIVLCIITTALMVVFYFQKQRYLKLYIASDATRYASFQKNPVVDASEVVYEQPP